MPMKVGDIRDAEVEETCCDRDTIVQSPLHAKTSRSDFIRYCFGGAGRRWMA